MGIYGNYINENYNKHKLKKCLIVSCFAGVGKNFAINYLTNKVFSSIIINEEICKLGILDEKHDELVIDFGKHIIYSTKM